MKIKIIKFRNDVKIPTRKHYNDAGLDCYCCEDITLLSNHDCYNEVGYYEKGKTTYKIPLGFGLDLPDGYVAIIKPRSSMNLKGILTFEGVIDAGYKGEICAVFTNLNDEPIEFHKGDRICQLIIEPIAICDIVETLGNEREENGFGSSGV